MRNDRRVRVLFSTTPLDGHFRPLLPLAQALRARGHEVAFATAGSWRSHVEAEGFGTLAAGTDHATARAVRLDREQETIGRLPALERRHYVFSYLFAEGHAPAKLPELIDAASSWRADVIVFESADLAAPIAAAALGLPSVNHAFGTMAPIGTVERAGAAVAPLYRQVGLEPDRYGGAFQGLYVDVVPPALDGDRPLGESIRLRPRLEAAEPPVWLGELPRPLVYATLGTVFNTPAAFRPLLDALGDADVGAVVTVGRDVEPEALGAVPANVRVEQFVPQAQVLPAVAAVISHGGSGTLLGALAAGVPLVLVPQGANQFENAVRCERIGVAANVPTGEPIGPALHAVLSDPAYAEAARGVQAEIEAMPTSDEVAQAVEEHVHAG